MAFIRKILFAGLILAIVFFISLFLVIRFQGKAFILKKAQAVFNRPVSVDEVNYVFPAGIQLENLNIQGLLFAESARIDAGPGLLRDGEITLDQVTLKEAVLTLHMDKDNHIHWKEEPVSGTVAALAANAAHHQKAVIRDLSVIQGKIIFPGHEQASAVEVYLTDITIAAQNVPLTGQPADTLFNISGRFLDGQPQTAGNAFKAAGSFNWSKRNLLADATVDGWRDQFDVDLKAASVNNDMTVQGHMKSRKEAADKAGDNGNDSTDLLKNLMKNSSLAVDMNFAFAMKMDRWELRNVDFSGNLSASKKDIAAPKGDGGQ